MDVWTCLALFCVFCSSFSLVCSLESLLACRKCIQFREWIKQKRASVCTGELQSLGLTGNSDIGGEQAASARSGSPGQALERQLSQSSYTGNGGPLSLASARGWKEGWQRCLSDTQILSYFMNKREPPDERGRRRFLQLMWSGMMADAPPGVLTWPSSVHTLPGVSSSPCKDPYLTRWGPHPYTSFDLSFPLKALSLRMATLGVRTSTCEIWGDTIQSIASISLGSHNFFKIWS